MKRVKNWVEKLGGKLGKKFGRNLAKNWTKIRQIIGQKNWAEKLGGKIGRKNWAKNVRRRKCDPLFEEDMHGLKILMNFMNTWSHHKTRQELHESFLNRLRM